MLLETSVSRVTVVNICIFNKVFDVWSFSVLCVINIVFLGVSNKQVERAIVESESSICLPKRKDWVVVIVTAIISPTRFFVQLPLGCKSPLSVDHQEEKQEDTGIHFTLL